MFIKYIICKVDENQKQNFSLAQEKWKNISNADGFIIQVGGWDLRNKNEAIIISLWENKKFLKVFMNNLHDSIFIKNKQGNTYSSIITSHFNSLLYLVGKINSINDVIKKGRFLRITENYVDSDKVDHFENMQKKILLHAQKESKGMFGGFLSKEDNNSFRYLVSTFWENIESHDNYIINIFPKLNIKSNVKNDTNRNIERQVLLIDSWNVNCDSKNPNK